MENIDKNTELPQCDKTAVMQSVIASELRTGNYVRFKDGYIKVLSTDILACEIRQPFRAIELTKEWFNKLGMTYYSLPTKSDRKIGYYTVKYGNRFKINSSDEKYSFLNFRKEIKYVHELQNLYFALTGAELTVA